MTGDNVRSSRNLAKISARIISTTTVTAVGLILAAPTSAADPTAHLKSEIDAARSESGCPPLQSDRRLSNVSERAAHEIDDYVKHSARSLPITGENDALASGAGGVLATMREAGYNTNKAKLLLGYGDSRTGGAGDNEAKAVKTAVLQGLGFDAIPDCSYTKYGLSAINEPNNQGWPSTPPKAYAVSVVLLAGNG
jgi:hypothetical protein